jgi:hypothetical protein
MEGLAMPSAEETATQLAHEFLRTGHYSASSGPVDIPEFRAMAAGAEDVEISTYASQAEGFSGLAVQSVGFEEGSKDPAVHIYLTRRVSRQQLKSLPKEVDGVPVRWDR